MCKTEPFQENPSPVFSHDDRPLAMKDFNVAKVYDFDFKYGQKSKLDFHEDLAAIDHSIMMQGRPKVVRRRRIIKKRKYPRFGFVPSLEDIKENELFETSSEEEIEKKDLAAIHRERALSCGMSVKEEGRRHRHKRHSRK